VPTFFRLAVLPICGWPQKPPFSPVMLMTSPTCGTALGFVKPWKEPLLLKLAEKS
jgi:hypothetical protein